MLPIVQTLLLKDGAMNNYIFDNNVYHNLFLSKTVMLIVPHEDDEINIGGEILPYLSKSTEKMICVFTTNGDFLNPASVRLNEALASLQLLGVKKENIYFLGYGDCSREPCNLYLNPQNTDGVTSCAGRMETYALEDHPDYRYQKEGHHHRYTLDNYRKDLVDILLEFLPDTIFAIGPDAHPDHLLCTFMLNAALQRILSRSGNKYFPRLFKGFAYETGFLGIKDFYGLNLRATTAARQAFRDTKVSNPMYSWKARVRFPVAPCCFSRYIFRNLIYHALSCHKSQAAMCAADSNINSDQIFWERKTTAVSYQGTFTASSGNAMAVNNFQFYAVKDIRDEPLTYCDTRENTWLPGQFDEKKEIKCSLARAEDIQQVSLYGNMEETSGILSGRLIFSNGEQMAVGKLKKYGRETIVTFPVKRAITWVAFILEKGFGLQPGLTAFEVYRTDSDEVKHPFLKIMVNDNFIYDYIVHPDENQIDLEVYRYDLFEKIQMELLQADGDCILEGSVLKLAENFRKVSVKAYAEGQEGIWDLVTIRRLSRWRIRKIIFLQEIERFFYRSLRRLLVAKNCLVTRFLT